MRLMEPFPMLCTDRLVLREFAMADATELHLLARSREVARTMLHHPHPYEEGMAEEWIQSLRPMFESGKGTTFAVVLQEGGTLISLNFLERRHGEVRRTQGSGAIGRTKTVRGRRSKRNETRVMIAATAQRNGQANARTTSANVSIGRG
jgi:RimJ/RimL family protein N-acetyltransferase